MSELFDVNLAAASTREFLRQGGRGAQLPWLWWYRFRNVIWLIEEGMPVRPSFEFCEAAVIPKTIVAQLQDLCSPLQPLHSAFRFVTLKPFDVQNILAAAALASDGRWVCQVSRMGTEARLSQSACFISALRDGTMLVSGNARHYWDPPATVRTQHLVGRTAFEVMTRHQRWLNRFSQTELATYTANDTIPVMQHLSRLLIEWYLRRGLFVLRKTDETAYHGE